MGRTSHLFLLLGLFASATYPRAATQNTPEKKYALGVILGLNIASVNAAGQFLSFGPYNGTKTGLIAGGVLEYNFRKNFSVQSGVLFISAGATTGDFTGTDEFGNELGKFRFVQDLRFLEFPILVSYKIPAGRFGFSLSAGPSIGVLLSAKQKFSADYPSSFQLDTDIKDRLKPVNIMFDFGGGVEFPIGLSYAFKVEVKYARGLTNQVDEERTVSSQKSEDIRVVSTISHRW